MTRWCTCTGCCGRRWSLAASGGRDTPRHARTKIFSVAFSCPLESARDRLVPPGAGWCWTVFPTSERASETSSLSQRIVPRMHTSPTLRARAPPHLRGFRCPCSCCPARRRSMLPLPIDTTELRFVATTMPEPVVDFTTRPPKADENGEPLYVVQLVALAAEGGGELITVKTAGAPKNVMPGVFVTVRDLVATPWSMNDRAGVSFKAA